MSRTTPDVSEEMPMRTPLRASYERLRALPLVQQMRECVDLLENPDVLAQDLAESFVLVDSCFPEVEDDEAELEAVAVEDDEEGEAEELALEHFSPGREVRVLTPEQDRVLEHAFTCVTGAFHPLLPLLPPQPPGAAPSVSLDEGGLDYLGLLREPAPSGAGPVLGAAESLSESTPYVVLLRLLTCLAEVVPAGPRAFLDRRVFKGGLGAEPVFDLHLVMWQPPDGATDAQVAEQASLFQLTRDAAELAKAACCETPQLAAAIGSIWCLRMDPAAFDGELTLEWSV